jgi:hypothetical protein
MNRANGNGLRDVRHRRALQNLEGTAGGDKNENSLADAALQN